MIKLHCCSDYVWSLCFKYPSCIFNVSYPVFRLVKHYMACLFPLIEYQNIMDLSIVSHPSLELFREISSFLSRFSDLVFGTDKFASFFL